MVHVTALEQTKPTIFLWLHGADHHPFGACCIRTTSVLEQLTHDQHQGSKNDLVHCGGVEPKNRRCYQHRCARVLLGGSSCAGLPLVCTFVCFARHVVGVVSLGQQVTMFAPQKYKNIVIFYCTALFSTTAALLRKVSRFCFTHAVSI